MTCMLKMVIMMAATTMEAIMVAITAATAHRRHPVMVLTIGVLIIDMTTTGDLMAIE